MLNIFDLSFFLELLIFSKLILIFRDRSKNIDSLILEQKNVRKIISFFSVKKMF